MRGWKEGTNCPDCSNMTALKSRLELLERVCAKVEPITRDWNNAQLPTWTQLNELVTAWEALAALREGKHGKT